MNKIARNTARRTHPAPVVLDTVGMVRNRNGAAVLRLKITGPAAKLQELAMTEGDRLRVHSRTLAVA